MKGWEEEYKYMTHFENQRATHQMNILRLARVSIEFFFVGMSFSGWLCGWLSSPVPNSQQRAKINCNWLSDCLSWPFSVCFSAGLLCLRRSVCVSMFFFFFTAFCFGLRQLLVVVLPSHPPTQRAYSIGQMFWDYSLSGLSDLTSTIWPPPVVSANVKIMF